MSTVPVHRRERHRTWTKIKDFLPTGTFVFPSQLLGFKFSFAWSMSNIMSGEKLNISKG
jgi:hypothetical protein